MKSIELRLPPLRCPACGTTLKIRYRIGEQGSHEAVCECPAEGCGFGETHVVADALIAVAAAGRRKSRAA